jgi:hypothetical protein
MGLPIRLNHRPTAWRTNPLVIPIRVWTDDAKTVPLDLTAFGTSWQAHARLDFDSTSVATFTLDTTHLAQGQITLTLDGTTTSALTKPFYVYDVSVTGGTISPLTLFIGTFLVDSDWRQQ